MLRYISILLLFLTSGAAVAQDRFANEAEAKQAMSRLSRMSASASKAALLLKLSDWLLLKGGRTPQELETSYSMAKEAGALSAQVKDEAGVASSFLQLAKVEGGRGHLDEGVALAQKAIASFGRLQLASPLGEAYVALWSNQCAKGISYPERIALLRLADSAFAIADNKRRRADCLLQIGDLTQSVGDWGKALPVLQESLRLYQAAGYKELQSIYDLLGNVNFALGDYRTGIEYGLLAIKTAEVVGDTSISMCPIYNHLGLAYSHIADYPTSQFYFEHSMAVARKYNNIGSIITVAFNYTNLLNNSKNSELALRFMTSLRKTYPSLDTLFRPVIASIMIDIYSKLNRRDDALVYCRIGDEELARGIGDYELEAVLMQSLIAFCFQQHDYARASRYSDRYDAFCRRINNMIFEDKNRLYKFRIDSAQGHYASAIHHLQGYMRLKDSLLNETKSKQISQLSALYETEKKDRNIHSLEQQAILQENRIRQAKVVRNFILAGVALLLLVVFLLYKAYQTKQRNNKLLQAHQQEIQEKNDALQQLVTEKEWLVKEIHHRVKNNLHMVVGLLASQAEFIKGKEALDAINESQHRIQAMSLIHQKLYQADNLSSIDMPSYIHELVEYLKTTFDRNLPIRFSLDIARVSFPLSHSIPIGLILNEAVTNALKYAFPGGREGEIFIRLLQSSPDHFTLSIHDNGIGLPPGFNAQSNATLGTTLMDGLSGDIGARFSMKSHEGTHIDIDFVVKALA